MAHRENNAPKDDNGSFNLARSSKKRRRISGELACRTYPVHPESLAAPACTTGRQLVRYPRSAQAAMPSRPISRLSQRLRTHGVGCARADYYGGMHHIEQGTLWPSRREPNHIRPRGGFAADLSSQLPVRYAFYGSCLQHHRQCSALRFRRGRGPSVPQIPAAPSSL